MAATTKQQDEKLKRLDQGARVLYKYVSNGEDPNYDSLGSFLKAHYIKVVEEILDAYNT